MFFTTQSNPFNKDGKFDATYHGYIENLNDALYVIEATRQGILNPIHERLTREQRKSITSGSIFVWEQGLSGMQRWTDGKIWSASKYVDQFLIYKEVLLEELKDTISLEVKNEAKNVKGLKSEVVPSIREGLTKKTISLSTIDKKRYHLISYYYLEDVLNNTLTLPSQDEKLKCITIPFNYYLREIGVRSSLDYINYGYGIKEKSKSPVEDTISKEKDNLRVTNLPSISSLNNLINNEGIDPNKIHNELSEVSPATRLPMVQSPGHDIQGTSSFPDLNPNTKSPDYHSEDKRQLELLRKNMSL